MPDAATRPPAAPQRAGPAWVWPPPTRGPRLVHVSAPGGGLAGLLHGLVRAQAAAGTPVGWAALAGGGELAATATYLHRLLHGRADPAGLAAGIAARYRRVLAPQAPWLAGQLTPDDVVVLHDPATLGLAPRLAGTGARLVWHSHAVAAPRSDAGPAALWREFTPELSTLDAVVTAATAPGPPAAPATHHYACAPAVDLAAPGNRELGRGEVDDLLSGLGLTSHQPDDRCPAVLEQHGPIPAGARVVLHVASRDSGADLPALVGCLPGLPADVHLVLAALDAGPAVLRAGLAGLSVVDRLRVHLVRPDAGRDPIGAALLLNALHRRADVVLQASLADGQGLTVPEAMAKRRPVVIADPGEFGALAGTAWPRGGSGWRPAVMAVLRILLDDPRLRRELGERAGLAMAGQGSLARLVADYRTFAAVRPRGAGRLPAAVSGGQETVPAGR